MAMVKVDFTDYGTLSSCPAWWRGFINETTDGLHSDKDRFVAIDAALEKEGILAIDDPNDPSSLVCVVFESEEVHSRFVTYWTLRGDLSWQVNKSS